MGSCSKVFVKKECFDRIGVFDENLPAGQDWDMWIRLAKYYQFYYISEPLVLYRIHEKRISTNPCAKIRAAKLLHKKFSIELNASTNREKILARWHYQLGTIYSECGNIAKARKEFMKAVSKNPYSFIYLSRLFASIFGLKTYNALRGLLEAQGSDIF